MTSTPSELFRQAAQAEDGMPISAGARVAHLQRSVASGRSLHVDLSAVPEERRSGVIAEVRKLVAAASAQSQTKKDSTPAPQSGS